LPSGSFSKVGRTIRDNYPPDGNGQRCGGGRFIGGRLRFRVGLVGFVRPDTRVGLHGAAEIYAAVFGDQNVAVRLFQPDFRDFQRRSRGAEGDVVRAELRPAAEPRSDIRLGDQEVDDLDVALEGQQLGGRMAQVSVDVQGSGIDVHVRERIDVCLDGGERCAGNFRVGFEQRLREYHDVAIEGRISAVANPWDDRVHPRNILRGRSEIPMWFCYRADVTKIGEARIVVLNRIARRVIESKRGNTRSGRCPTGTALYPWKPYVTTVSARGLKFAGTLPELSCGDEPLEETACAGL
jgi:hypothetical protein